LSENVVHIDFEPLREPEVHLPAGCNVEQPSDLFMLFFTEELVSKIVDFTNKNGASNRDQASKSVIMFLLTIVGKFLGH
jgi:hypothetical protein